MSLACAVFLTAGFMTLPVLLGAEFLQPLSLVVLLAIQVGLYSVSLRLSARLLARRKERIIEALGSTR